MPSPASSSRRSRKGKGKDVASPADFTTQWWCSAVDAGAATGLFPELVLATWGIDTGWGAAQGMLDCHALLGIVCHGGHWHGPDAWPCTLCNPTLCFYCYPDFDTFLRDFAAVLGDVTYDVVRVQSTAEGQAEALANQTGFAGAPPNPEYLASLLAAMATIRSFNPFCPEPPPPPSVQIPSLVAMLVGAGLVYTSASLLIRARKGGL